VRKVLLVGCSGEIGSRLANLLLNEGFTVYGIRNARNCEIFHPMHHCEEKNLLMHKVDMSNIRPEILIHTAWLTTPGVFWNSEVNKSWVKASKQIIEEFIGCGGKYLVVTGSCAEYAWDSPNPLNEDSSENPNTLYGVARMELLNWIRERSLPYLWTRTFFQFGMREAPGRLIPSLIDAFEKNSKYVIQNRNHIRDFVFVEDVAQIMHKLILLRQNGIVNIGSGIGQSVGGISLMVMHAMGKRGLVQYSQGEVTDSQVVSNTQKLDSIIGKYEWVPTEEAISRSIDARLK